MTLHGMCTSDCDKFCILFFHTSGEGEWNYCKSFFREMRDKYAEQIDGLMNE
jgi:hypothetical protein